MSFSRVVHIMGETRKLSVAEAYDHNTLLNYVLDTERRRMLEHAVNDIHKRLIIGNETYIVGVVIKLDGKPYASREAFGIDVKNYIINKYIKELKGDEDGIIVYNEMSVHKLFNINELMDRRAELYLDVLREFHHKLKRQLGYPL